MRLRLRRGGIRGRNRDEGGFTLPELIVALAIETVIFGALATAFVVVLNGGATVNENLKRTSDARFAAAYFVSDARNSSGPEVSSTDMSGCVDPSPPVVGTEAPVVQFQWDAPSSDGTKTVHQVSDYVVVAGSLLRRHCEGTSTGLVVDQVLASSVSTVPASTAPVMTCDPDPGCTAASVSISVTITETLDSQAVAGTTPYSFTLSAAFRKLIGGGAPLTPATPHPLILLGSGGACTDDTTGVSVSGSANLRIYGDAYINTADGSSCSAMSIGGGGTYRAASTSILAGGTCIPGGGSVCPKYASYSPAIGDPFSGLPAPSTTGLTNQGNSCSSYGTQTAQPGIYKNTFAPASGSCNLASGIYYLQNGFNLGNGVKLTADPGGVLIYVAGGSFTIGGGTTITLPAMTSGTYAGVAVWQPAVNQSTLVISGGAAVTINGAIYAPKAQLRIDGGSSTPQVSVVVVRTLNASNGAKLAVGVPSATPLSIGASGFPPSTWTVNRPYPSTTLIGQGGDGNYTWSVTGMPVGMTFDPATGIVAGTPTVVASGAATVTLTDALGDDPSVQSFTLNIVAGPTITTTSPLANAALTRAYINGIVGAGGTTPFIWSATGLPPGLTMGNLNGVISGTPTGSLGTSSVVVTLTDASGSPVNKTFSLKVVSAPSITTVSVPSAELTISYSTTLAATSGTTPYNWSAAGLPAGLNINSGTGVISGTPTVAGTASVDVTLTDAVGTTATQNLALVVLPRPSISSVTLGGTTGSLSAGDTVSVVFATPMSVNKFCSTWSNDALDQSITANNSVTVAVSNATNDTLTVTSTACTFNFGSLNLASNGYVSAATTFKGTGANASKITWTAATHTLVITLGAKATGTVGTVASSTPIYTASTAIKDPNGLGLTNSPFTLPTGRQF